MPCDVFSQCEVGWQPARGGAEDRGRAGSPRRASSTQLRAALIPQQPLPSLLGRAACSLTGKEGDVGLFTFVLRLLNQDY